MGEMVDMEMDDERQLGHPTPYPVDSPARFPYGLRLCLCDDEMKKLGLEADVDVGDYVEIRAYACVTSVHKDDMGSRVELQIEKMAVEDEGAETEDDD